tara:strand:- start:217 stop:351 length:135 start_codon:yes stop_codon:yes gene_type:complete
MGTREQKTINKNKNENLPVDDFTLSVNAKPIKRKRAKDQEKTFV